MKMHSSFCLMQDMVPVSGVPGTVTQWDVGSLWVQCQAGQGLWGRRWPRRRVLPVLAPSVRVFARVVCGRTAVGWSRQPDGKHGQTSRPFSTALGSQA